MDGNGCLPLEGAVVDVWHCDAEGVYSGVSERGFGTTGLEFLRGVQWTDAEGRAVFQTIYPGWYPGRGPHPFQDPDRPRRTCRLRADLAGVLPGRAHDAIFANAP